MSLFRKKEKKQVAIEPDENLEEKTPSPCVIIKQSHLYGGVLRQ